MKRRGRASGLLIGGSLLACGTPDHQPDALAGQTAPIPAAYPLGGHHLLLTSTTASQARSTAAIRGTGVDANTDHATCGATFVSRHFAVTAAHCLDQYALGARFEVETFRTANLDTDHVLFTSSAVSGTWPNWTRGPELTSEHGWARDVLTCHVVRRCSSSEGGVQSCPAAVTPDVDIALIHCPHRSSSLPFATTTAASDLGKEVEVWWFHEILNLPTTPSETDERFLHYGRRQAVRNENYHYRVRHQLLPLVALARPDLTRYRTLSTVGSTEIATDVPVCHGTSGSGVFARGQNVLFGPVRQGVFSGTELCERAELTQAGVGISTYVRASITHAFVVGAPEVLADRE